MKPHIRWMIRRDMPEVLAIEEASFRYPWIEADFISCLRQRNCIGMVAEHDEQIIGYMLYELFTHRIDLLNIAVRLDSRRQGVGSRLLAKLKSKLGGQRRRKIIADVWEDNLEAQLFFKRQGFLATEIVAVTTTVQDFADYRFEYQYDAEETQAAAAMFRTPAKEVTQ